MCYNYNNLYKPSLKLTPPHRSLVPQLDLSITLPGGQDVDVGVETEGQYLGVASGKEESGSRK